MVAMFRKNCLTCNYLTDDEYGAFCKLRKMYPQKTIENCEWHNKDISNEKICCNCEFFLGGGDWGLSCKKDYYTLVDSVSKACENFSKKENK